MQSHSELAAHLSEFKGLAILQHEWREARPGEKLFRMTPSSLAEAASDIECALHC